MGLLKVIRRRSWKKEVVSEFDFIHGVALSTISDQIGKRTINEILNSHYEVAAQNPQRAALNVGRTLVDSFGIKLNAADHGSQI